jgi:ADP-ribose pyrophosphatase YjhB (NUDIX family)
VSEAYRVRACAVVLRSPGEILTLRAGERIELPGVEPRAGESLETAAVRVVAERAGFDVVATEIAFVAERRTGDARATLDVCFYANAAGKLKAKSTGDAVWVALHDARLREIVPDVRGLENSSRGRYFNASAKR